MAEPTHDIPPETWRSFFDSLSRDLAPVEATVVVETERLGPRVEADRLRLTGITYDDRDDVLVIGLDAPGGPPEDLEHLVYQPKRIAVDDTEALPSVIQIESSEGRQTRIELRPVGAPGTEPPLPKH